jgi:hypothetical protein
VASIVLRILLAASFVCLACDAAQAAVPPAAGVPDQMVEPTPDDEAELRQLTHRYLTARDARDYATAFAILAPGLQAQTTFEEWGFDRDGASFHAGALVSRRITLIRWYRNPEGAPAGVYAAVDLSSAYTRQSIHCSTLMYRREGDGSFRIIRETDNFVETEIARQMSPEQVASVKAQYNCRE